MKKKNLKNNIIIATITVVLLVAIVLIIVNPFNISFGKKSNSSSQSVENNDEVTSAIIEVANKYYEEFFYPGVEISYPTEETKKEFFDLIVDSGITAKFNELIASGYSFDEELNKQLNDSKCDFNESKVVISPSEPYGAKDYKVTVSLSCNNE